MHASLVLTLAAGLLLTPSAFADTPSEQVPLTGQMAEPPSAAPAPTRAPPAPPPPPAPPAPQPPTAAATPVVQAHSHASTLGTSTRQLLQLQASGTRAAPHRPMLGDQAAASYQRYLDSFSHPIPEFFRTTIQDAQSTD